MKAKIYPLKNVSGPISVPASYFLFQLEIICASLANGTSIIKNIIEGENIDTTIAWCKNLGAIIKKNQDRLIIKGINNHLSTINSLFVSNNLLTIQLMLPLICCLSQPLGVKTTPEIINLLQKHEQILSSIGVEYYIENTNIRLESKITSSTIDLSSLDSIPSIVGFLLALPFLNQEVKVLLPNNEHVKNELFIALRVMRKFNVDFKHFTIKGIEIDANQKYKSCKIETELDLTSYILSTLLVYLYENEKNHFTISNYVSFSIQGENKILNLLKKKLVSTKDMFGKHCIKPKTFHLSKLNINEGYYYLPLLLVLAALNDVDIPLMNMKDEESISKQYEILELAFQKMNISISKVDDVISISPNRHNKKVQIDSMGDSKIIVALSYMALFLAEPLIIRNVDNLLLENRDFYTNLQKFGVKVEIIHD